MLSKEEKYNAVINNDRRYDNEFIYAVKSTGIFCRPSCPSKPPLNINVSYYENSQDALNAGYRPCKRCRPDLKSFDPKDELLREAKQIILENLHKSDKIEVILQDRGITKETLTRILKERDLISYSLFIKKMRIQKAALLLKTTNKNVLEIVNECGFQSTSAFYRNFKKFKNISLKDYRKNELIK